MNYRALLSGLFVGVAVGLMGGPGLPYAESDFPMLGAGLSGLLAGGVAGYVNAGTVGRDAAHGVVAAVAGSALLGAVLLALGAVTPTFGLTAGLATLLFVTVTVVPGTLGGALGGTLADAGEARRPEPTA
ncbi:hypothetical protein C474_00420 [Halogeometricum pallidum JCM 14848]|uniref:DUF5518 domain-containing protein n=1 Tax=Halogeometricum pallidum JCM 14848 TaxID=1227487 RepID=M0DI18_HALPD|nr:DUF5518 domain-containing protein [Halogeometricum pallidum]ELZ35090.1 hypothetical protein C474_00420 [Halogeometricum pallidum JCM 14848]